MSDQDDIVRNEYEGALLKSDDGATWTKVADVVTSYMQQLQDAGKFLDDTNLNVFPARPKEMRDVADAIASSAQSLAPKTFESPIVKSPFMPFATTQAINIPINPLNGQLSNDDEEPDKPYFIGIDPGFNPDRQAISRMGRVHKGDITIANYEQFEKVMGQKRVMMVDHISPFPTEPISKEKVEAWKSIFDRLPKVKDFAGIYGSGRGAAQKLSNYNQIDTILTQFSSSKGWEILIDGKPKQEPKPIEFIYGEDPIHKTIEDFDWGAKLDVETEYTKWSAPTRMGNDFIQKLEHEKQQAKEKLKPKEIVLPPSAESREITASIVNEHFKEKRRIVQVCENAYATYDEKDLNAASYLIKIESINWNLYYFDKLRMHSKNGVRPNTAYHGGWHSEERAARVDVKNAMISINRFPQYIIDIPVVLTALINNELWRLFGLAPLEANGKQFCVAYARWVDPKEPEWFHRQTKLAKMVQLTK